MTRSCCICLLATLLSVPNLLAQPDEPRTYYVDVNLTGGTNSGLNWANAFNGPNALHAGLAAAEGHNGLDHVWVAQGTYRPDVVDPNDPNDVPDRTRSFVIPPHTKVYGSFVNGATSILARNEFATPSILDGDIGTTGVDSDNAFHVVRIRTADPGEHMKISGFVIQNGNADDPNGVIDPNDPYQVTNSMGGGIVCPEIHAPALERLIIRDNKARLAGAGLISRTKSKLRLTNCRFENNLVTGSGGIGGGLAALNETYVVLQNCVFYNNRCTGSNSLGGGVYLTSTRQNADDNFVTSCTFSENSATGASVGGTARYGHAVYSTETCQVKNSISWNNGGGSQAQFDGTGTYGVVWSNIQMGTWTADDDNIYPALDPLFRDPSNGNLTLLPCSPCVDAGRRLLHTFQNVWIWYIERDQTDLNENGDFGEEEEEADTELTPWDAANHHRLIVYRGAPAEPNDALDMGGTESCPGDFTGDGLVGLSDLANLLAIFGSPQGTYPRGDVDLPDLAVLLTHWGE